MKFISLPLNDDNLKEVFMVVEEVVAIVPAGIKNTLVYLKGGVSFFIAETPYDIIEKMKVASNEK